MTLHAPQIIYSILLILSFALHISRHGEPRTDRYSAGIALLGTVIAFSLLWWGGFFK